MKICENTEQRGDRERLGKWINRCPMEFNIMKHTLSDQRRKVHKHLKGKRKVTDHKHNDSRLQYIII